MLQYSVIPKLRFMGANHTFSDRFSQETFGGKYTTVPDSRLNSCELKEIQFSVAHRHERDCAMRSNSGTLPKDGFVIRSAANN